MDQLKALLAKFVTWYIISYIVIILAFAFVVNLITNETERAEAFDNRRDYDICLSGNEFRTDLFEALKGFRDDLITSARENPEADEAAIATYVARTDRRLAPLKELRDCSELLGGNR